MNKLGLWSPWRSGNNLPDLWDDDWGWTDYTGNEMDMYEEDGNLIVKLRAPGFKKDDLDITVKGNTLTINGSMNKDEEDKDKKRKYIRRESMYKSFTRRIDLPMGIKASDIKADFSDGIVTLTMPESEESMPRKIKL